LEQNQRCLFLSNAAMQWLDIRLQLIGVAVVTGLGVIAIIQHQYGSVDPGETTTEKCGVVDSVKYIRRLIAAVK